jgi:hypothetical protein
MKTYSGPGVYVAICNKANFDGHYIEVFRVPAADDPDWPEYAQVDMHRVSASWWFLNRVNFTACLEDVYPLEIFKLLQEGSCYGVDNGEPDNPRPDPKPQADGRCYGDNDEAPMWDSASPLCDAWRNKDVESLKK